MFPRGTSYVGNQEWMFNIAAGVTPGFSRFRRFGFNAAVGTSWVPIWTPGGLHVYPDPLAPTTFTITSNDAQDDIAGTGLQKLTCIYADDNWDFITEELDMNGSGTVATSGTGVRFIRAYGSQWGTGRENVAKIDITATAGVAAGEVQADVPIGENQTLITQFSIPRGKTGFIVYQRRGVGRGDDAQIKLVQREGNVVNSGWRINGVFPLFQSVKYDENPCPDSFPEMTDLVVMAKSSASPVTVGAEYTLILADN